MKTPMQELIDINEANGFKIPNHITKRLLEKERQMVIEAWHNGCDTIKFDNGTDYFELTYNNK